MVKVFNIKRERVDDEKCDVCDEIYSVRCTVCQNLTDEYSYCPKCDKKINRNGRFYFAEKVYCPSCNYTMTNMFVLAENEHMRKKFHNCL